MPLIPKADLASIQNPNEPGDLPWSIKLGLLGEFFRRKNRGRKGDLKIPANNPVTLIEVIGEDSLAAMTAIACSLVREEADQADRPSVVGFVRWGTDGYQHSAEFDFVNGLQLALAGSYVQVIAQIDSDAPGNGVVNDGSFHPISVGATIGYFPPATRPITRTRYASFAGAGAVTVPVPPFAREVTLLKSVAATVVTLEQLDRAGVTLVLETGAGQLHQVLVNDCRNVRITAAGGPLLTRAVFDLYL